MYKVFVVIGGTLLTGTILTRWFTADTHFQHINILKYTGRPYKDILDMDLSLMDNWNSRVKEEDLVYHLGDFSLRRPYYWRTTLNGRIILIKGNHDKYEDTRCFDYKKQLEIKIGKFKCLLIHRPSHIPEDIYQRVDFVIHGHIHNNWLREGKKVNVGVDVWNFKPISETELYRYLKSL